MRRLLGLGAAVLAASAGWAVDWKTLKPSGYVSDFAGVVDPASKAHLEAYAAELQRTTGAQIALVTLPILEGEPPEDVALSIARAWGVGQKGRNDGVLLLLAIHERRSRLEVGSGLASVLPAGFEGRVLREMRPALRVQQYGEAMMAAAETIGSAIARARRVHLTTTLPRRLRPAIASALPWPFLLCGILELAVLGFLVTWAMRRAGGGRRAFRPASSFAGNPPLILESGTHTGGGFGSFDSSDSFGGFGGGDFGGGRASSDW
jgi:uncharacterized protein